jgi:hypothetical protein
MNQELENLTGEALAIDAQIAPVMAAAEGVPEAAAVVANDAEEIAALLQLLAAMAAPLFPSIAKIYTPEECAKIGAAAAPVMVKRGWSMGGVMGAWAEELVLLAAVAPVALATWDAVQSDMAAANKKAREDGGAVNLGAVPVVVSGLVPEVEPRA